MANSWRGSDTHITMQSRQVRHAFSSYWYHGKKVDSMTLIRQNCPDHVVDSGAHSFFSESHLGSARVVQRKHRKAHDPHSYFDAYLEWLLEQQNNLDYFVELDIGELVGQDVVEKWRDRIVAAGLEKKCLIVFHPRVEPFERFFEAAKEWPSRFVGLEGVRGARVPMNYNDVVQQLHEHQIRPHGFAMIKPKWITNVPFYSVDSTSFTAGASFGRVFSRRLPRWMLGPSSGAAKGFRTHQSKASDGYFDAQRSAAVALEAVKSSSGLLTAADVLTLYKGKSGPSGNDQGRARLMIAAALVFNELEDEVTRLWESRGIRWE